jgi:hypothetical protein
MGWRLTVKRKNTTETHHRRKKTGKKRGGTGPARDSVPQDPALVAPAGAAAAADQYTILNTKYTLNNIFHIIPGISHKIVDDLRTTIYANHEDLNFNETIIENFNNYVNLLKNKIVDIPQMTINIKNIKERKMKCFLPNKLKTDYVELYIIDDGECLFYALSVILYNTPIYFNEIKMVMVILYYMIFTLPDNNPLIPILMNPFMNQDNPVYDPNTAKNISIVRFCALMKKYSGNDNAQKTLFKNTLMSYKSDLPALYDQEVGVGSASYGTETDIRFFISLFKKNVKIIQYSHTDSINTDPTADQHILYNCKTAETNRIASTQSANHFELLVKYSAAVKDPAIEHINTIYGPATRVDDSLFCLDTILDDDSKSKQNIIEVSAAPAASTADPTVLTVAPTASTAAPTASTAAPTASTAAPTVPLAAPLYTSKSSIESKTYNPTTKSTIVIFENGVQITADQDEHPQQYRCTFSSQT